MRKSKRRCNVDKQQEDHEGQAQVCPQLPMQYTALTTPKPLLGRKDGRWAVIARYDDPLCPEGSISQGLLVFEERTRILFLTPEEFISLYSIMVPELWRFLALVLVNLDFQETHAAEIECAKSILRNSAKPKAAEEGATDEH
jgi:hypothetical protein